MDENFGKVWIFLPTKTYITVQIFLNIWTPHIIYSNSLSARFFLDRNAHCLKTFCISKKPPLMMDSNCTKHSLDIQYHIHYNHIFSISR